MALVLLSSCSAPSYDACDAAGKAAAIDAVNGHLSNGDCDSAVEVIEPLYENDCVDNDIRLARAASHACSAGVDFLSLVDRVTELDVDTSQGVIWETLAQLFPSSDSDDRVESSWLSTDALLAMVKGGTVVSSSNTMGTSPNEGSLKRTDREDDANAYLLFVSMATIGTMSNRYGNPNANYKKTTDLPWTTADSMTEEGCAYAGAVVNLFDSVESLLSNVSGTIKTTLEEINSIPPDIQCEYGCRGRNTTDTAAAEGVTVSASCNATCDSACPKALRDRTSCMASSQAKCAAAGLIRYLNGNDTTPAPGYWESG